MSCNTTKRLEGRFQLKFRFKISRQSISTQDGSKVRLESTCRTLRKEKEKLKSNHLKTRRVTNPTLKTQTIRNTRTELQRDSSKV
jgi:hypothetical protein